MPAAAIAATELLVHTTVPSPIGDLLLVGRGDALVGLYVADHEHCPRVPTGCARDDDALEEARGQLDEYFAGTRRTFDLRVEPLGGTAFQRAVWRALLDVPYGETAGYGEIARRLGRPTAARAVGAANGRNPVSIVVPCHRVVGADGRLTGYGWGNERKAWLLDHERRFA